MTVDAAVTALLVELRSAGCRLWLEEGKLKVRTGKEGLSDELKGRLKAHKEAIIGHFSGQREAIPKQPADSPIQASHAQRRLWFLARLEGDSASYNMPAALRLTGELNVAALRDTFRVLVERHQSLRLRFPEVNGEMGVAVTSAYDPLMVTDLGSRPAGERGAELERLMQEHAERPFDLERGPLLRLQLIRLDLQQQVLLLNMHHIISDNWSIGILMKEWASLYRAFAQGVEPQLEPLTIDYSDYAAWQRQWLSGERLQRQFEYWSGQLGDAPEVLELPADFPRPALRRYRGALLKSELDRRLSEALRALGQRHGATLYMTLLAGFAVLLHRYSGQQDILIGSPIANRPTRDTEGLVGFFLNTLVLRTRFPERTSFAELLDQVRRTTLDAHAHQDIPFELLVERLNPRRSLSHSPLFQVMFVLQNNERVALDLPGLAVAPMEQQRTLAKFDLLLSIDEGDDRLLLHWEYARDLFRRERIQRMAEHFALLLEGMVAGKDDDLLALPMLTEAEGRQLCEWNRTETADCRGESIVNLFEAQVVRTPERTAVLFADCPLSYRELNRRANRLAHALIDCGVGANRLVGICMERSLEMVIGLLATLKAGGAYLPLDPDYPRQRLQWMLEESNLHLILTQSGLLERFEGQTLATLCVDREPGLADQSDCNPDAIVGPDQLAYVLFTSGSSGRPKGVAMPHRSLVNLVRWQAAQPDLAAAATTLQFTSLNFDVSFQEIFTTWCGGGRLVLVEDAVRRDANALLAYLAEQRIERIFLPFVALNQLAESAAAGPRLALKSIITAGEQLKLSAPLKAFLRRQGCRLYNHYGPTESHVVTSYELAMELDQEPPLPPIGRPIANTRIHLLNGRQRPQPIGVAGELCIAGECLARGYLNRPELSAERFIETELFGRGERIYKTGDLARWREDGNLEYLGRIDQQFKYRGYRIEPGEIEAVLCQHDAVSEAVVTLHERDGHPSLAAYISASDRQPSPEALRDFLGQRLPDYMIPTRFTLLERLPLSPNGKVDRGALPEPEAAVDRGETPVRTESEALLATLWSALLKVDVISVTANFFDLGGHSLLATQLASRIRDGFAVEMPLRTLFEHPVLGDLAAWLDRQQRGDLPPPIEVQPEGAPLRLSHAQQRLWFLARLEGASTAYNMPVALKITGGLDRQALRQTFLLLIERHQSLRMCFPAVSGAPSPRILPPYDPLVITDLSRQADGEREASLQRLLSAAAAEPFDLANGPLLRLQLILLPGDEQVLLLNLHHIISDGWSEAILVREWAAIYDAVRQGRAPELEPLPIRYTDYAAWQREWLRGEVLEGQLAYWTEQLRGAPQLLELPADFPRPALQSYRGATLVSALDPRSSQRLKAFAREQGCTLFMTLLAAFALLLYRYSERDDLLIGAPAANRGQGRSENIIGFFVNVLVARVRVPQGVGFTALLEQVRKTALAAYAHQELPFEQLVERLNPERSLSHSPLFQVMFDLQDRRESPLDLPGLSVEPLELAGRIAKYDLSLGAIDTGDRLEFHWEYATELFCEERIRRMAGHFGVLLEAVLEQPSRDIRLLPLLTPQERRQLEAWNSTAVDYPLERTLVDRFEEQVERDPARIAVIFGERRLSYRELNQRANRIAWRLIELGVAADTLVAVCAERSLEMVSGLLGILKAGGAYLPLDPDYPRERLQLMLEDSRAPILLTQPQLAGRLPQTGARLVYLDGEQAADEGASDNPKGRAGPGDLAYLIYTSGSTGRPKGVRVQQDSLMNYILALADLCAFSPDDVVLQFSSISFDAAAEEIFTPLTHGGQLVLRTRQMLDAPESFFAACGRWGISLLLLPTAFWQYLLAAVIKARGNEDGTAASGFFPDSLRLMLIGGEKLTEEHLADWYRIAPEIPLINGYGPTEGTIATAFWGSTASATRACIGRPIANTRIHILDHNRQPLPIGVAGELCIAGVGLARDYLDRPELTAERFIQVELFGQCERIYRTGDLARWRADGQLEYLGRIDHQVKLRGFRIELGEIEAVMRQHPALGEAVVMLHQGEGNPSLAAYLTLTDGKAAGLDGVTLIAELRQHLKARLPGYMVPASFTLLDELPLTPNGKIDRRGLPAPDGEATGSSGQTPQNATEQRIAEAWRQVLGREQVGTRDNFFDMGGHSLLVVQLLQLLQVQYPMLKIIDLFSYPTIQTLAAYLDHPPPSAADGRARERHARRKARQRGLKGRGS